MATSALTRSKRTQPVQGLSPQVVSLAQELAADTMKTVGSGECGSLSIEHRIGRDSFWTLVRCGSGGLALRLAHWAGGGPADVEKARDGWRLQTPIGDVAIRFSAEEGETPLIRWTTTLTPIADLLPEVAPRDLYVLGKDDDPAQSQGRIEAAQRGLNTGLLYFTTEHSPIGAALYLQNFTALADWFDALNTKPEGVVGGSWPELGYRPPNSPAVYGQATAPLKAGAPIVVSDVLLAISPERPKAEKAIARTFLDLMGRVYRPLEKPVPEHRDWPQRAEQTLKDLAGSPKATIEHWGQTFIHPYVDAEYPDSMVQLAVLSSIARYDRWRGKVDPLQARLKAGVGRFHHAKTGGLGRYLSNVGADKDADAVDSWYLYHPMMNLARLAEWGDDDARKLFMASLNYVIRAAHHFDYAWPIQFKASTFAVITAERNETGLGQTDVGGLYAYVMTQAYNLTGEAIYLDEARAALRKVEGLGFELNYQANLTAWGAAACVRLSRLTDEDRWMEQAHVFLASFFHNTMIWDSRIGTARHFSNFLGASCLQDAPYMAIYECYEAAAAFDEILMTVQDELSTGAVMLMAEYRRFAFDRAWSFYPDALPPEAIATDIRNGHIDRTLSFPVEDLYVDGQPAGQVGQEIYGCGAAFLFASAGFHNVAGAPFTLFCDYPLVIEPEENDVLRLTIQGPPDCPCALRIIDAPKGMRLSLETDDEKLSDKRRGEFRQFTVKARKPMRLSWAA